MTRNPLAAWPLTGSALVVLAAALVLLGLNASRLNAGRIGFYGLLSVGVLAYAGAGGLIARRVPGNVIGWLLGTAGLALTVAMLTEQYALYGLATAPGAVPAAKVAGSLSAAAVVLTIIVLFVLVLLFPDGRLPSPRWRPVLGALAVVVAGVVAQSFQAGTRVTGGITNALDAAGVAYPNPLGVLPRHGWFSGLLAGIFVLALVTGLLVVASVFVRRRGASPERRQQLAWLGYVGVLTVFWAAVLFIGGALAPGPSDALVGTVIWSLLFLTPVAGIPLACVVAIVLLARGANVMRSLLWPWAIAVPVGCVADVRSASGVSPSRSCARHRRERPDRRAVTNTDLSASAAPHCGARAYR